MWSSRKSRVINGGERGRQIGTVPVTRKQADSPYIAGRTNPFRLLLCIGFILLVIIGIAVVVVIVFLSVFGQVKDDDSTTPPRPPDCTLQCEQGVPDAACDVCICEQGVFIGRVTDVNKRPLLGATIADADNADEILAISDSSGSCRVSGFCSASRDMVIRRNDYITAVVRSVITDSLTTTLDAVLEREELPYFVEHPANKLRVVGDSVVLCCKAKGSPSPSYQWFKDDYPLHVTSETLLLSSLTMEDAGFYKCRANNDAGSLFSNSAELTISAGFDTCETKPMDHIIQLPQTCQQAETNSATYNIGTCKPYLCGLGNDQTRCQDQYCCQPDKQEVMQIQCQGYSMSVTKTSSCKCALCKDNGITVSGLVELSTNGERVRDINVFVNDEKVATTDSAGQFSFNLPSQKARVPVTFKDERSTRQILDTTDIFLTTPSLDIYREVKVLPIPQPVVIDSASENDLNLGSFASLVIPPNSFFDTNGQLHAGSVSAYIRSIDLRETAELQLIPGDFQASNLDGDQIQLRSYGVFALAFTDLIGNPLWSSNPLAVVIDPQKIPRVQQTNGRVQLWNFNPRTGLWQQLSSITRAQSKRRRRQGELFEGIITLTDNWTWFNIDEPEYDDLCWAKVVTYRTSNLLGDVLDGTTVTAVTADGQPTFHRLYEDVSEDFGVCVPVGCRNTENPDLESIIYTVHLTASIGSTPLLPADSTLPGFSISLADRDDLSYTINSETFASSIQIMPELNHASLNGPIFKFEDEDACRESQGKHFQFYADSIVSWGAWGIWSECDVTCGQGYQVRTRTCYTPALCNPNEDLETRECSVDRLCPSWLNWGLWSSCSATCGDGVEERQRQCEEQGQCNGEDSEQRSCSAEECVYDGNWAAWNPWTPCDATCGGGQQVRTRICENGSCYGFGEEVRACNEEQCPFSDWMDWGPWGACSVGCGSGEWMRTRECDEQGDNECRGDSSETQTCFVQQCSGTLSDWGAWSGVGTQERTRTCMEGGTIASDCPGLKESRKCCALPLVTEHPRNKLRAVGDIVKFCCAATGSPPVTTYEWFKDEISVGSGQSLTLTGLQTADSGSYQCKVTNIVGSAFSNEATLTVSGDTLPCDSEPIDKIIQLPPDCALTEFNIKTCSGEPCSGTVADQAQCVDDQEYQCGVISTIDVTPVECDGYQYPLQQVDECGCVAAEVLPATVSGRTVSEFGENPLEAASVLMNDEVVATTDSNGFFDVKITTGITRVSLTFRDNSDNVVETTRIAQVESGSNVFLLVKMKRRPKPMRIESNQESVIDLLAEDFDPVGCVVIPPDSVVDADGEPYTGPVDVYLANYDVRSALESPDTIPGDFTAGDTDGNLMQLETFGVFSLDFRGSDGQELSIDGSIPIYLDTSEIPALEENLGPDGMSDVKMWTLNKNTGLWEESSPLVRSNGGRRRRQAGSFEGILDLPSRGVYNIDKVRNFDNICWAKIIAYSSNEFLSSQVLTDTYFRIIIEETNSTLSQFYYGWSRSSAGDGGDGACVTVACDSNNSNKFNSIIVGRTSHLIPATAEEQTSISESESLDELGYTIVEGDANDALKLTIDKSTVTSFSSQGPVYTYEQFDQCRMAGNDTAHFQFYIDVDFSVLKFNTQPEHYPIDTVIPTFTRFAFYPQTPDGVSPSHPCFIRFIFEGEIRNAGAVRVIAKSFAENESLFPQSDTRPILYGTRQTDAILLKGYSAELCMEYKCPGRVVDTDSSTGTDALLGVDSATRVELQIRDVFDNPLTCHICSDSESFLETVAIDPPVSGCRRNQRDGYEYSSTFNFTIPISSFDDDGLYGQSVPLSSERVCSHDLQNCIAGSRPMNAFYLSCYDGVDGGDEGQRPPQ